MCVYIYIMRIYTHMFVFRSQGFSDLDLSLKA